MINGLARVSANFSVGEFARASHRPLQESDLPQIQWWAEKILQPARDALGPIRITSYIRPEDVGRAHENGGGIDVVPIDVSVSDLWNWIGIYLPYKFGRIINERTHVHIARPGPERWAGYGVTLVEPVEGSYQLADVGQPPPHVAQGQTFSGPALATMGIFFLLLKRG